jgi:hypothetical protein
MNRGDIRPLFAVVGALFLGACGKKFDPSVRSVPTTPVAAMRVLAFGDSLTAGKDLADPDRDGYPGFWNGY